MHKSLTVSDQGELALLNAWLAGGQFERHRIAYSAGKSVLDIPFHRVERARRRVVGGIPLFRKWGIPVVEWRLSVSHVTDFRIHAASFEHGDRGDYFNAFTYDAAAGILHLSTAFSRGMEIKVDKFSVTVMDTGKVVRECFRWPLSGIFEG